MDATYLAFDLGAESGRAMAGRLRSGVLDLAEICCFPNEPVRDGASLRWDLPRLWREMQRGLNLVSSNGVALDSIGVDTWGCDYGLLDEDGALVSNPYHYRDARTDGVMDAVFERVPRSRIYDVTGIQFLPFNTIYQLVAAARSSGELAAAQSFGTIPDILNHQLTGVVRAEFTNARQRKPDTPGSYTRAIMESLAFKSRIVLDALEGLTGTRITEIQIIGGGSRNRLLNRFIADATGRTVIAGPVEATALGNIAMQMIATGGASSIAEARRIIERSFPVERIDPADAERWDAHYRRFTEYVEQGCV